MNKTKKPSERKLDQSIINIIVLHLSTHYGNRAVDAGKIRYFCSKRMGIILDTTEANIVEEYYNAA